jgi:hypothetical protein
MDFRVTYCERAAAEDVDRRDRWIGDKAPEDLPPDEACRAR